MNSPSPITGRARKLRWHYVVLSVSFSISLHLKIPVLFAKTTIYALFQFRKAFWVIFKKYLLVGASGMLRVNGWVNEWEMYVCMSHQSDWIYYKKPIKFHVVKVNSMWGDLILIQFRTAIFILLKKRRNYSCIGLISTSSEARILWAGLINICNWIISQRNIVFGI